MQIKSNNDLMIALKQIPKIEIDSLISSKYQTKDWRASQEWYINGKHNECEQYQKKFIEHIIGQECNKTDDRIFIETNNIVNIGNPMKYSNGFEYTEDFDGKIIKNNNIIYFNMKFVCDNGGAQTRTLREVYHFIRYQLEYLIKYQTNNVYFYNILDGETSYKNMIRFNYLINLEKYKSIKKHVYIGDLIGFSKIYNISHKS